MSQDQDKAPSFVQQFVVFFLLITVSQIAFSYFELDTYFFSKPDHAVQTDTDTPPIATLTNRNPPSLIFATAQNLTASFDENSGQIYEISLNNYWTNMQHKEKISTIFQPDDLALSPQEKEQSVADEFLLLNANADGYEKAVCLKSTVTKDDRKIVVQREYSKFSAKISYTLTDGFVIEKSIEINAKQPIELYSYTELRNKNTALVKGTEEGFRMFQGASFHTAATKYAKIPFSQFAKKKFNEETAEGGSWIAFSQRYFATAIKSDLPVTLYTNYISGQNTCIAGMISQPIRLEAGKSKTLTSHIYSGPEDRGALAKFATGFEYVIDFGVLWPVCDVLLSALLLIQKVVGDWGVSMIILTAVIRLISFGISLPQQKSLKKLEKIKPQQEALRKQFLNDDMAYNTAMWELHKREKISYFSMIMATIVNPLLQIPVFIGFYSLLMESIILRQTTFLSLTGDLSLADPTYILPAIFLVTGLLQQRVSPQIQNPDMAAAMRIMPFMFAAFSTTLPAGLLVYWIASNLFTSLQTILSAKKVHERPV